MDGLIFSFSSGQKLLDPISFLVRLKASWALPSSFFFSFFLLFFFLASLVGPRIWASLGLFTLSLISFHYRLFLPFKLNWTEGMRLVGPFLLPFSFHYFAPLISFVLPLGSIEPMVCALLGSSFSHFLHFRLGWVKVISMVGYFILLSFLSFTHFISFSFFHRSKFGLLSSPSLLFFPFFPRA